MPCPRPIFPPGGHCACLRTVLQAGAGQTQSDWGREESEDRRETAEGGEESEDRRETAEGGEETEAANNIICHIIQVICFSIIFCEQIKDNGCQDN